MTDYIAGIDLENFQGLTLANVIVLEDPIFVPKVYHTSNKQDWETPHKFFARLDEEFKFTLDAAASPISAKCPDFLSLELGMNALDTELDWWGRVYLNPPYDLTEKFLQKLIAEIDNGHCDIAVALVAARTDTEWWWQAVKFASEVRFLKGRLRFEITVQSAEVDGSVCEYAFAGNAKVIKVEMRPTGQFTTYALAGAPFPSAVLVFNKHQLKRKYYQWDWKTDLFADYAYKMPKHFSQSEILQKLKDKEQQLAGSLMTGTLPNDPVMNTALAHILAALPPEQLQSVMIAYGEMTMENQKTALYNSLAQGFLPHVKQLTFGGKG